MILHDKQSNRTVLKINFLHSYKLFIIYNGCTSNMSLLLKEDTKTIEKKHFKQILDFKDFQYSIKDFFKVNMTEENVNNFLFSIEEIFQSFYLTCKNSTSKKSKKMKI